MSYAFGATPASKHQGSPDTADSQDVHEGQQHDRIQLQEQDNSSMAGSGSQDITATQRMISATWGSVLTSVLGMMGLSLRDIPSNCW